MRKVITVAFIVVVGVAICESLVAQGTQKSKVKQTDVVGDLKKRPDLGVDYMRVAKLKLVSRKTSYRIGEMIDIDIAIMNASDAPVIFHKLTRPTLELQAQAANGVTVSINTYHTVLEGLAANSYQRLEPGYMLSHTFQLLAGCDDSGLKAYSQARHRLEEEEHSGGERVFFKGLFERDLFVNWGEACLTIKIPGKYTIIAEQSNDTVLLSPNNPKVKTAVGRIRSSPLTITIVE